MLYVQAYMGKKKKYVLNSAAFGLFLAYPAAADIL